MLRTRLLLMLIVVASALGTVTSTNRARNLFAQLNRQQAHMHSLNVEWGQLQLEQSTWANHARIERIAREQLQMKLPAANQIIFVNPVK